ncbi:MAG: CHAT domain-containing protein [Microcoleaceae cyanobacterium]
MTKSALQLYQWLIQPLEDYLKIINAKTIIYAPDGQLRYIPLAGLYDGDKWLVERFKINNITAASLMNIQKKSNVEVKILAGGLSEGSYNFEVGNNKFSFDALAFAAPEVNSLASLFPDTKKLLDNAFTREAVVAQMNQYNIVHLATHAAFVRGKPEDSFILFGDGDRVTLRDVESWDLKNVDLVVLSACQTGVGGILGNGEEILGFGYMMQQAGALATLASLWRVDDQATQKLMQVFYAQLESGNITKAEALRQAQISLISSNYKGGHPYYWSPFILICNGL